MLKKSPLLYFGILIVWTVFLITFYPDLSQVVRDSWDFKTDKLSLTLLRASSILAVSLISYFWLNGLKDIFYTFVYWFSDKTKLNYKPSALGSVYQDLPRVDLIYTVCDDFDEFSLWQSMQQEYPSQLLTYYILDDSKTKKSREIIDEFALKHSLRVIRRFSSKGFKAGNINFWLKNNHNLAPFFVILDSDEIIPPSFIKGILPYFEDSHIAIAQANHIATRSDTIFAKLFAAGVDSHWPTYQSIKNRYGFMSLLGHGAMLRTAAVQNVGGFPEIVAEDLGLAINLAKIGQRVVFVPEVVCQETYPIDYFAFKKRHTKWTMGNMEFIKKFSSLFLLKKLTWFEKLDILLFTYNLPLTVLFITFLLIHLIIFPILGFIPRYVDILLLPTVLTLLAPLLNDLIYFFRKIDPLGYLRYFLGSIALYGSLYFISFWAALKALFGQAVFLVTPKVASEIGIAQSFWKNRSEIIFATVLFSISYMIDQPWSVILIVIPSYLSLFLGLLSNLYIKPNRYKYFTGALGLTMIIVGILLSFSIPSISKTTGQVAGVSEKRDTNTDFKQLQTTISKPENIDKGVKCLQNAELVKCFR